MDTRSVGCRWGRAIDTPDNGLPTSCPLCSTERKTVHNSDTMGVRISSRMRPPLAPATPGRDVRVHGQSRRGVLQLQGPLWLVGQETGAGVEKHAPRERHACPGDGCSGVGAQSEVHGFSGHPARALRGRPAVVLPLKCRPGAGPRHLSGRCHPWAHQAGHGFRFLHGVLGSALAASRASVRLAGASYRGACAAEGIKGPGVTWQWLAVHRRQPGGETRTQGRPHG